MGVISDWFFEHLLQLVDTAYPPKSKGRPRSVSNAECITVLWHVIRSGASWSSLRDIITIYDPHTVRRRVAKWIESGIIDQSYTHLQQYIISNNLIPDEDKEIMVIDATFIRNINGIDIKGKNHYDRYRQSNKLSLIITKTEIPLATTLVQGNKTDLSQVLSTLIEVPNMPEPAILLGDKGYIDRWTRTYLNQYANVNLIAKTKTNALHPNTPEEEQLLDKYRSKVESVFATFHSHKRVHERSEKKFIIFQAYCKCVIINMTCRKLAI